MLGRTLYLNLMQEKEEIYNKKKNSINRTHVGYGVSLVPAASITAHVATSAKTSSISSYCTVNVSQSLINKKGKQYATVKFKT